MTRSSRSRLVSRVVVADVVVADVVAARSRVNCHVLAVGWRVAVAVGKFSSPAPSSRWGERFGVNFYKQKRTG